MGSKTHIDELEEDENVGELAHQLRRAEGCILDLKAALIEERQMRYIKEGMKIEQARIHAETEVRSALATSPPDSEPAEDALEDNA